jgi:hypothetical protein
VATSEKRIKELTMVLDQGAAVIKAQPRLAALFAPHTAGIKAKIADLQRQTTELRTASIEGRKEMEDIRAHLENQRKRATFFGPLPRAKLCQLQIRS